MGFVQPGARRRGVAEKAQGAFGDGQDPEHAGELLVLVAGMTIASGPDLPSSWMPRIRTASSMMSSVLIRGSPWLPSNSRR
jgi:hypothetical protein